MPELTQLIDERNGKGQFVKGSKPIAGFQKGCISLMKGKCHSSETKQKISELTKIAMNKPEMKSRLSLARKGKKRSIRIREKMSLVLLGNKRCLGKKQSEEHRKNISKSHKGEKNWNWKGGITPENLQIRRGIEFRLWREAVFARDNWTCQKTKIKGGRLHPHHIQNFAQYPELRFAIDNGITLLDKAHREFHHIYGSKNNTKEQLEKFLR